jgi:hypothetical protein
MTYTFLHRGVAMGESDLSHKTRRRGQRAGAFHPTVYGRTLLPRVVCILQVGLAFKSQLQSLKRTASDATPDEMNRLLYESEAGRAMIDAGRVLSEVELRGPDGRRMDFTSIAFSDIEEIRTVGKAIGARSVEKLNDLPPEAPEFIVSVTLGRAPSSSRQPTRARSKFALRRFQH